MSTQRTTKTDADRIFDEIRRDDRIATWIAVTFVVVMVVIMALLCFAEATK